MGGPLRFAAAASLIWIPLCMGASAHASAQTSAQEAAAATELSASAAAPVVPQQVRFAGKLATRAGDTVEAVFRIYAAEEGGEPLWTETQRVAVADDGSYTVLLGSASPTGLPQAVFSGGVARWLGVSVERAAEVERVQLSSVPYAMKSADAESLAGHAAADFVTQAQLAQLAALAPQAALAGQQTAVPAPDAQPNGSGTVTGSGTAGTVPLWTGALTQGNSEIVQVGTDIGINEATPATTLDVGGAATVRGTLALPPRYTATKTGGAALSQEMQLSASTWSTTANAPIDQTFTLVTYPTGNDTATPSGFLQLEYQNGTAPAAYILSINSSGTINFAPTQAFPGTIKSVSATSPVTAATTSGAVSLGLNTAALETTLNGIYPRLSAANAFTGNQSISGGLTVTGAVAGGSSAVTGLSSAAAGFLSNGAVTVKPGTLATAAAAVSSPLLELGASAYSSTSTSAVAQNYAWQTQISGNDTAAPTANLALLFGAGTATPASTGLSIAPSGIINFASGQTFPGGGGGGGTITGITTTSPLTGSGTSGSVALGLDTGALLPAITPPLEGTFNGVYAQLAAANSFTGNQSVAGTVTSSVDAPGALGPILALTNPGGGLNAAASVDFRTYLHTATAATPSARIVAVDDNNYGNNLFFESNPDGYDTNELQTNVEIPSTGGVIAWGQTNSSGVGAVGVTGEGGDSTGGSGGDAGDFYAGYATEGYFGGDGIFAQGGSSDTGFGGAGGAFIGGDVSTSDGYGGSGAVFQGGSGPGSGNGGAGILVIPGVGAYAGVFDGDVVIHGTVSATTKQFKIDHPIDPANKYLVHTSVESSEDMNIYTGNVVTDQYGNAVVKLPDWFQALNTDFRYQLTVIGQFAQAIVSKEIENNQFTISTNATFVKVSWQVTGVRQDPYAKAHPLVVEQEKPANERGFYIHPELYGQPEEKQTEWGRHPQMMQNLKARRQQRSARPAPRPALNGETHLNKVADDFAGQPPPSRPSPGKSRVSQAPSP
jgi:hypothetical protein